MKTAVDLDIDASHEFPRSEDLGQDNLSFFWPRACIRDEFNLRSDLQKR